jgi:TPR repeat protein
MGTLKYTLLLWLSLPIASLAGVTASCDRALEICTSDISSRSACIPKLKVGANDGDAACAAIVGSSLLNVEQSKKEGYVPDSKEGYKYIKQAVLAIDELDDSLKSDVFYSLGRAYFDGKPVLQNFKIAYAWFSMAAALDHSLAKQMRDTTFFKLRQANMADGVQNLALQCKTSPRRCLPE